MIDASGRAIRLEIDGGVKADNIAEIAAAGADTFVAGSAIFNAADYADVISRMKSAVTAADEGGGRRLLACMSPAPGGVAHGPPKKKAEPRHAASALRILEAIPPPPVVPDMASHAPGRR